MTDEVISEEVARFILQYIDSIAQWEGLLLLRADPSVEWSAESVAQRLYTSKADAARLLDHWISKGFVYNTGKGYIYQTVSPELDLKVEQVAECYTKFLVPITHLIHSKPKTRVQEFADAFWLRKD